MGGILTVKLREYMIHLHQVRGASHGETPVNLKFSYIRVQVFDLFAPRFRGSMLICKFVELFYMLAYGLQTDPTIRIC